MYVAAIIAAGGRGARLGADRPKQFLEIDGRSILAMSVAALAASDRIQEIVVALPEDYLDAVANSLQGSVKTPLRFVAGGTRRQDSVANASQIATLNKGDLEGLAGTVPRHLLDKVDEGLRWFLHLNR